MKAPTTSSGVRDDALANHSGTLTDALRRARVLAEAFGAHNEEYRGVSVDRDALAVQFEMLLQQLEQAQSAWVGVSEAVASEASGFAGRLA